MITPNTTNFGSIKQSVYRLKENVDNTNASTKKINSSIDKQNTLKRRVMSKDVFFFRRRREAVRRKERESIIEASGLGGSFRRSAKVLKDSTRGFLGRILDFFGILLVGWVVNNIPKIISLAESFYKRAQAYFDVAKKFVKSVTGLMTSFGEGLGKIYKDITILNFSNIPQTIDDTMTQINQKYQEILFSFEESSKMLQQDFAKLLGLDVPSLPDDKSTSGSTSGSGSKSGSGSGSGSSNPILKLVRSAEGGYDSMYPREKYPEMLDMTITELVAFQKSKLRDGSGRASAAVGAYQFLYPEEYVTLAGLTMNSKFTPENQDKLALAFLKARGITVEAFKRDRVGTALKLAQGFAGVPVLAPTQGKNRFIQRGESFYSGDGINAATVSAERTENAIDQFISTTSSKKQIKYDKNGNEITDRDARDPWVNPDGSVLKPDSYINQLPKTLSNNIAQAPKPKRKTDLYLISQTKEVVKHNFIPFNSGNGNNMASGVNTNNDLSNQFISLGIS